MEARAERTQFHDLLETFYDEMQRILQLVDIAEDQRAIESDASVNDTLLQASLVLMVAQAEGFVKATISEFSDSLNRSGVPLRRLSDQLRHLHTSQAIEDLVRCDEESRGKRVRTLRQQLNLWWDDDRALRPSVNASQQGLLSKKRLQRQVTSVNGDQVREVLQIIGCSRDVCGESTTLMDAGELRELLVGREKRAVGVRETWEVGAATANIGEKLSDLVQKRNTIAHGNGRVSLSKGDVLEALAFMCSFAALFQAAVTVHLQATLTLG